MLEIIKKNYIRIAIMGIFVFLIHGAKWNSVVIGLDTEKIINLQDAFYKGWLETGRQGLVGLIYALGCRNFNPFFSGLVTLLFLVMGIGAFLMLWDTVLGVQEKNTGVGFVIAALVWISHPQLTEELYFSLQSMEICLGNVFVVLSLFLVKLWSEKRKWRYFLSSVIFGIFAFSMYQAFVPLYIFGAISIILLQSLDDLKKENNHSGIIQDVVPYLFSFLISFFMNLCITKLFFSSSNYLQNQIVWGREDTKLGIQNILRHMVQLYRGDGSIYYSAFCGCLLLVTFLYLCAFCYRNRGRKKSAYFTIWFSFFALSMSPFLMTIICGCQPVVRSQFVLPALTAFMTYLCIWLYSRGRACRLEKAIIIMMIAVGIWKQTQITMRLYYTEQCRYEQDVARAREMMIQLHEVQGQYPLPVAFVGALPFTGNSSTLVGETMGHSFFEHDAKVEPYSYYSSQRILGLMRVLGETYVQVKPEKMAEAWEHSYYMPEWPSANSVQRFDHMIVVKLAYWEENE